MLQNRHVPSSCGRAVKGRVGLCVFACSKEPSLLVLHSHSVTVSPRGTMYAMSRFVVKLTEIGNQFGAWLDSEPNVDL